MGFWNASPKIFGPFFFDLSDVMCFTNFNFEQHVPKGAYAKQQMQLSRL
jgi:hypothetical protein